MSSLRDLYQTINDTEDGPSHAGLAMHPWRLSFLDPKMEVEFQASTSDDKGLTLYLGLFMTLQIVWIIASAVNPDYWDVSVESAPYRGVAALLTGCGAGFSHIMPREGYVRGYQSALCGASVLIMVVLLGTAAVDSAATGKPYILSSIGLLSYILLMSTYAVYLGLFAVYTFPLTVVFTVVTIGISQLDRSHHPYRGFFIMILIMAAVVNIIASYSLETWKRQRFSSACRLGQINLQVGKLLDDLLPPVISHEVRSRGTDEDRSVTFELPMVTVLFVSIEHFADFVESKPAQELFDFLNIVLARFDEVIRCNNLYKVEYIEGDYVVTSILVRDLNMEVDTEGYRRRQAAELMHVAFQLLDVGQQFNVKLKAGLATGPSVAGIIGRSRKFYRLFGDTVNTASRMKAYGEAGRVHVTARTYQLVQTHELCRSFNFTERTLDVKGKGLMKTYLVDRPPASPMVGSAHSTKGGGVAGGNARHSARVSGRYSVNTPTTVPEREESSMASPTDAAHAIGQSSEIGFNQAKRARLRYFSNKFAERRIEDAFALTRMEHRTSNMKLNTCLSIIAVLWTCVAVTVFVDSEWAAVIVPASILCASVIGGAASAAVRGHAPTNKEIKKYIWWITAPYFFLVMLIALLEPGGYAYVCYQLCVDLMVITGAGVGLAVKMLSYSFIIFHIIMAFGADAFRSVSWSFLILLLMFIVLVYASYTQSRVRMLWFLELCTKRECRQARQLLESMLPSFVIEEMATGGSSPPRDCQNLVVLFSDISGFTRLSARLTPLQLVHMMHDIYKQFDVLVGQFDLYKMDTIGDAFVVIGGLSGVTEQNVRNVVLRMVEVAHGMIQILADYRERTGYDVQMRIGIHRGPAIAGVVGTTNKRFHVFGKTIELANKLESDGLKGYIHLSNVIATDVFNYYKLRHRYDDSESSTIKSRRELLDSATFLVAGKIDATRVHNRRASTVDTLLVKRSKAALPDWLREVLVEDTSLVELDRILEDDAERGSNENRKGFHLFMHRLRGFSARGSDRFNTRERGSHHSSDGVEEKRNHAGDNGGSSERKQHDAGADAMETGQSAATNGGRTATGGGGGDGDSSVRRTGTSRSPVHQTGDDPDADEDTPDDRNGNSGGGSGSEGGNGGGVVEPDDVVIALTRNPRDIKLQMTSQTTAVAKL